MSLTKDIKPISYLKANAASILDHLHTTRRPMIITQNGEAKAVIQDAESYEQMKCAIGILKLIAQSEKDIQAGRIVDQDDLFDKLENELA